MPDQTSSLEPVRSSETFCTPEMSTSLPWVDATSDVKSRDESSCADCSNTTRSSFHSLSVALAVPLPLALGFCLADTVAVTVSVPFRGDFSSTIWLTLLE